MGWLLKFFKSSIGKKFIVALAGSFLLIFLIVHLIGNITLFFGPEAFNEYVKILDSIKLLIRIIEVVLLAAFIFHIYYGTILWLENKKAQGGKFVGKYRINGSRENSSFSSRSSFVTGSIVFIFLVIHLGTFFWRFNVHDPEGLADIHQYFNIVTGYFTIWWYVVLYVIAVLLLGFHLNQGFQSAFQTFGWNQKKYFPIIKKCGTIYAIIMTVGFVAMPIYFFFFYGGNL